MVELPAWLKRSHLNHSPRQKPVTAQDISLPIYLYSTNDPFWTDTADVAGSGKSGETGKQTNISPGQFPQNLPIPVPPLSSTKPPTRLHGQPLSPIVEQDDTPSSPTHPFDAASMDHSEETKITELSSVFLPFISRPVRSGSQSTARTYLSGRSSMSPSSPPVIPILDLRPTFDPTLGMPQPSHSSFYGSEVPENSEGGSLHAESFVTATDVVKGSHVSGTQQSGFNMSTYSSIPPWSRLLGRAHKGRTIDVPTPGCWMFWLGFLCPCIWLVGGWYFTDPRLWPQARGAKRSLDPEKYEFQLSDPHAAVYPYVRIRLRVDTSKPSIQLDPWISRCRCGCLLAAVACVVLPISIVVLALR